MELWQLVTRHHHMLHPFFCDHHQVSDASADVVSAHGESESCEHRERDETKGGQRRSKDRKRNIGQGEQAQLCSFWYS